MTDQTKPLEHSVAGLLSFAAGFADTAGFLGLHGIFPAHVTGNLVVLGAELARQETSGIRPRLGSWRASRSSGWAFKMP